MSQLGASRCESNTCGYPHLMSGEQIIFFDGQCERNKGMKNICVAAYGVKPSQSFIPLCLKNLPRIRRTTCDGFKIACKLWRVTMKDFFGNRCITIAEPMREFFYQLIDEKRGKFR